MIYVYIREQKGGGGKIGLGVGKMGWERKLSCVGKWAGAVGEDYHLVGGDGEDPFDELVVEGGRAELTHAAERLICFSRDEELTYRMGWGVGVGDRGGG